MRRLLLVPLLAAFACAGPSRELVPEPAPLSYRRVYSVGERYRYELRRNFFTNGALRDIAVATSAHEVVGPAPLRERIAFERLTVNTDGREEDRTSAFARFSPYLVSIAPDAPKDGLLLPSLAGLESPATGMVTDLHTFLVAVSPQAGVEKLHRVGDRSEGSEPRVGDWSNAGSVPLGQDCVQISLRLVDLDDETATIETSFEPPAARCLALRAPWMARPVIAGAVPNNFQQVSRGADGLMAMWGQERFVVRATVQRRDGKILRATMDNVLTLQVRTGCDDELASCAGEVPLSLRRTLTLTAR